MESRKLMESFIVAVLSISIIGKGVEAVRSKSLGTLTNCHDCVFQQTKCIQQCLSTFDCTKNIVKEGFCPYGGSVVIRNCPKISTLNSCEKDEDCAGSKKCCNNGCRKMCSSPLPFPPPSVSAASSFKPHIYKPRRRNYRIRRLWSPTRKPKRRNFPIRVPKTIAITTTSTTEKPSVESHSEDAVSQSEEHSKEIDFDEESESYESEEKSSEK